MKYFVIIFLAMSALLCHAEESKEARIAELQTEIEQLEGELKKLSRFIPPDIKKQNYLQCYVHCIKMAPVTCRVQMGQYRVKDIPGGRYYVSCPKKCNYGWKPYTGDAKTQHRGCVHYDKHQFWFVTYICNKHRYTWSFKMVNYYKKLHRAYPAFDNHIGNYRRYYKSLLEKKKLLNELQPPLTLTPDDDDNSSQNSAKELNLNFRLNGQIIFELKNDAIYIEQGADSLSGTVFITDASGASRRWQAKKSLPLGFNSSRIEKVEIIKSTRKNVALFKLTKNNAKKANSLKNNKLIYTGSKIAIDDAERGTAEYQIKIYFE